MLRILVCVVAFAAFDCASAPVPPTCALSETDRAWVDRTLEAWRLCSREITGIQPVPGVEVIYFGADCARRNGDALSSPTADGVTWSSSPNSGNVALPDGSEIPVGITSFAAGGKEMPFFVMSTPSVWQADPSMTGRFGGIGLETAMVAVMLHESSHLAQLAPYGPRLGRLIGRNQLPDSINDNAVQERFKTNIEFAESVKQEPQLLLDAASARDDAEATKLASEGCRLMLERQARWMVGDDAYLVEAEDIWLTFEGAGQWTGYQWLVHPQGGAQPAAETVERFTKGRQWSQTEGGSPS